MISRINNKQNEVTMKKMSMYKIRILIQKKIIKVFKKKHKRALAIEQYMMIDGCQIT